MQSLQRWGAVEEGAITTMVHGVLAILNDANEETALEQAVDHQSDRKQGSQRCRYHCGLTDLHLRASHFSLRASPFSPIWWVTLDWRCDLPEESMNRALTGWDTIV